VKGKKLTDEEKVKSYRCQLDRQNRWRNKRYRKELDELLNLLGGECKWCKSKIKLEIHHSNGDRDWPLSKIGSLQRVRKYRKEYEEGISLFILCKACNRAESNFRRFEHYDKIPSDVPF
jgi:hypothetical protein